MSHNSEQPTGGFGLLASGASGSWTVDLDESTDGLEWSLQLDGPQVYVHFPIRDPSIVRDALDYLRGVGRLASCASDGSILRAFPFFGNMKKISDVS